MNRELVERIARAVLYEGYILYPYRPSVKNRQRWTFGGLYPEAFCTSRGSDSPSNQTEVLIEGGSATTFEAEVRFLHLTARQVGALEQTLPPGADLGDVPFRPVETLRVGDRMLHTWQEAEERVLALPGITLAELTDRPHTMSFRFPGGRRVESVPGPDGAIVGVLVRDQQTIEGTVEADAVEAGAGLYRVRIRVVNRTPLAEDQGRDREQAVLRALVSTHLLLGVREGEFVSLLDPPEGLGREAAKCLNIGVWPVLVGADGDRDTMLSAPIILYDYPQVAPESPGDFFDGTEIDEMLTLRILTLTDEEKQAMAAVDDRAGTLLVRTEALAREQLMGLHGTMRNVRG